MEKKILVVDDNKNLRELVVDMLTSFWAGNDMSIISALDVENAQEVIKKIEVDLIISDIEMPGKDGLTFFKEVKEAPKSSHIPFIFMSGSRESCQKARKVGIVLEKPFKFNELIEATKNLLEIS